MEKKIGLDARYAPSKDVVAREVAGEFIIIPIACGIGEVDDEMFSLNETGRAIWEMLDGKKSLREVCRCLASAFNGPAEEIEKDCVGLVGELLKRKIIREVNG